MMQMSNMPSGMGGLNMHGAGYDGGMSNMDGPPPPQPGSNFMFPDDFSGDGFGPGFGPGGPMH